MIERKLTDRYRLESELGRGGMGAVYRAWDRVLDRQVAIKILNNNGDLGTEGRGRLLSESRAAARLNHPNIVAIFDAGEGTAEGEFEGEPFVVMELVDGVSLYDHKPETIAETIDITRQLSSALAHAHAHGIVHRDLKLENVLIQNNGRVKLMDFGLARSITTRLTGEGLISGTVYYLAPELALGQPYDGRADLYALGVMLYELTTGELPFVGDDPLAVISQHIHSPVVPPRARNHQISPSLEHLILNLLAKQPEDRPVDARAVLRILERLEEEDTSASEFEFPILERIVRGRLVGREAELTEARVYLHRALSGEGMVLLISGEPGIGKTRLARELLAQARIGGAKILAGGCYEYEAQTPYLPVAEALRDWIRGQDPDKLRQQLGESAPEIYRLAPELEVKLGPIASNPPLAPQEERLRMFDNLARYFRSLARDGGLVFFVDDLHWADRGTLSLLPYILRRLRNDRFLILATYREVELDRAHPLSAALVEWNRDRFAIRISLGRLSQMDTTRLLATLFDQAQVPDELSLAIYRETEGNPFFIEEVIKSLIGQGKIYRAEDRWVIDDLENLAIPQSIKEAVGRRLNELRPETIEILHTASVYGKDFPFDLLTKSFPGRDDVLLDALDEAEQAQLIRPETGERFVFTHDKIREVLYEEQNPIRRRRAHLKIGELLEDSRLNQKDDVVQELAHHFVHGGELHKGFRYSVLTAEKSSQLFAYEEALQSYVDALACAETLDLNEEVTNVNIAMGDIYSLIGPVSEAINHFNLALRQLEDPTWRAGLMAKIGAIMISVGDLEGADFLLSALRDLDADNQPLETATALTAMGRSLHLLARYREAIDYYKKALDLVEPLDEPLTLSNIYSLLAGSYQHRTSFPESLHWANTVIEYGKRKNFPLAVAYGYEFIAEDYFMMGRFKESLEAAARDREIGAQIGSMFRITWADFSSAISLHGLGELHESAKKFRQLIPQAEEIGDRRLAILSGAFYTRVLADLGQDREVKEEFERWSKEAEELGEYNLIFSCVYGPLEMHLLHEEWDEAIALVEPMIRRFENTEMLSGILMAQPDRAAAYLGRGDIDRAEEIVQLALAHAKQAGAHIHEGRCLRVVAEIEILRGNWEHGEAMFQSGRDLLQKIGCRLEEGRLLERRGWLRYKAGREADGLADLEIAREIFVSAGAVSDVSRSGVRMAKIEPTPDNDQ